MNRQLLIIDDDRATHGLVCAHLANRQTNCISALDGAEGIQRAVEAKPSAILLDMDMPNMNGMEVFRRLKANPQTEEIPIVFLTGDRTVKSKIRSIDMGAVDYVTKPFDPFELRARVQSVFRAADAIESVRGKAGVDEATGMWNRAFLCRQIERDLAAAARTKQMVTCSFVSVDRFDELAEKMGQPGGNDLIREAAEAIFSAVRLEDVVCRYDARTMAVLGFVPDVKTGRVLGERLRSCVGTIGLHSFLEPEPITCSVGSIVSNANVGPVILRMAEKALGEAKMDGNRVVLWSDDVIGPADEGAAFN